MGRVLPRGRSSAAEARPGSHRRSFTKKVSRPAPLTYSPAPAGTRAPAAYGSAPGLARAPAAATAPSPRGPGRVRLELTVPPARRARRIRAPCSRRAARRRGNTHRPQPRTRALAAHAPGAPPRTPTITTAQARTRRTPLPACPASLPRSRPLFPASRPPPLHPSSRTGAPAVLGSAPPPAALRTTPGQVLWPLPRTAPFA